MYQESQRQTRDDKELIEQLQAENNTLRQTQQAENLQKPPRPISQNISYV